VDWGLVVQEWRLLPAGILDILTSPGTILAVAAGGVIGIIAGILPGLTAVMAMALLLGFMFQLPLDAGLGLLVGTFTGSIYAGSITAIMLNIPGTPAAAATVLDGFPLAKKGKAREAVGTATLASFFGEVFGEFGTLLLLPFIAVLAMQLGDWEVFLVAMIGVLLAGGLAGDNPVKGWIAGSLGILVAMVGTDPIYGVQRFGYTPQLLRGIEFVPALIGLFGLAEVFHALRSRTPYQLTGSPGRAITLWSEFLSFAALRNLVRSSFIGMGTGLIPGVGESAAPWLAYDAAKRRSKRPQDFGRGSHEGLMAAETANNATSGGSLIPMMVLGIPGSGPTAVLLAALFMYGVRPGPLLIVESPGFIGRTIALFWLSAIMMRLLAFLGSAYFIRLLSIPREVILPLAVCLGYIGAWGAGFTRFDIWVVFVFGVIGYVLRSRGFPLAPMVLGVLVGPIADRSLRRALITYGESYPAMFARPVGVLLVGVLILMIWVTFKRPAAKLEEKVVAEGSDAVVHEPADPNVDHEDGEENR
jgi:putative tricarboxylic transport membrane protein